MPLGADSRSRISSLRIDGCVAGKDRWHERDHRFKFREKRRAGTWLRFKLCLTWLAPRLQAVADVGNGARQSRGTRSQIDWQGRHGVGQGCSEINRTPGQRNEGAHADTVQWVVSWSGRDGDEERQRQRSHIAPAGSTSWLQAEFLTHNTPCVPVSPAIGYPTLRQSRSWEKKHEKPPQQRT